MPRPAFPVAKPFSDQPRPPIALNPVQSNQIESIGYDSSTSTLAVRFRLTQAQYDELRAAEAERDRLHRLVNTPQTDDFLDAVRAEKAHQIERWGHAHDRSKSAEHWFWLVGYLAGKALRAAIAGDKDKALHHCVSSAAALANWFDSIKADTSGAGIGTDADLSVKDT